MKKKDIKSFFKLLILALPAGIIFYFIFFYKEANQRLLSLTGVNLDTMTKSLAERNNNPLNIRSTSIDWKGESKTNKTGFEVFESPLMGARAALINLKTKVKQGFITVEQIIKVWAPPTENATDSYIKTVSSGMGVSSKFELSKPNDFISLAYNMHIVEAGKSWMTKGDFQKAWELI